MTEAEKREWWNRTLTALEQRDPRLFVAMLTALVLRHGNLEQCNANHTHVVERISLEELVHTVDAYHIGTRVAEWGVIEVQAVSKGDVHGQPPDPGSGGFTRFK